MHVDPAADDEKADTQYKDLLPMKTNLKINPNGISTFVNDVEPPSSSPSDAETFIDAPDGEELPNAPAALDLNPNAACTFGSMVAASSSRKPNLVGPFWYGPFALGPTAGVSGVYSDDARPANVTAVTLSPGAGVGPAKLTIAFTANSTAHALVSDIKKTPTGLVVTVADYADPKATGLQVVRFEHAEIELPKMPAGTAVTVLNRDGTPLFVGALPVEPTEITQATAHEELETGKLIVSAFEQQFPPRYTSKLDIDMSTFKLQKGGDGDWSFQFTAKEYGGSFAGKRILKGERHFTGTYNPAALLTSFNETTE